MKLNERLTELVILGGLLDLVSRETEWNLNLSLPQILYNQQSVEVQGNLKRKLITRLQPDTDYSFVLMSRGNSAGGLQQQVSIRTAPDLFKSKPVLFQPDQTSTGKFTVNLPKVPTTAPVRSVRQSCCFFNATFVVFPQKNK